MNNVVDYKKLIWASGLFGVVVIFALTKISQLSIGLNIDTFGAIGTIAGFNWFAWEAFKKWLWKAPLFRGWLVLIPDLNGSWEGKFRSTWIDQKTGKTIAPINAVARIKQDLTTITIDFTTDEMESCSIIAEISCDPHRRVAEINYTYQSDPDATVRHRSEMHYGSARLVYGRTALGETLKGDYWTDRKTTGSISLKRKKK